MIALDNVILINTPTLSSADSTPMIGGRITELRIHEIIERISIVMICNENKRNIAHCYKVTYKHTI